MDDTMRGAVLAAVQAELGAILAWLEDAEGLDLATAEQTVRARVLAVGARLLTTGLAGRGTGKAGPRRPCGCGGSAVFEGYRPKGVQTLVGWIELRRAYYVCPACGQGQVPLDAALGVGRDGHSPAVRRLASQFGALLPFGPAATALADAAGIHLSRSTVRSVTEAIGARRGAEVAAQVQRAWTVGLPAVATPAPDRLYVAMDGVRILGTDGEGMEAKVGVVAPERRDATGTSPAAATYAVSLESADGFGRRLALEAHRRGLELAREVVVLGDGAAWIWNLAAEHFPTATQIVDWYHASERVWDLGRALYGAETAETAAWVVRQLALLGRGQVNAMVAAWQTLPCPGTAAAVRDEQVTYFTNQADRMAYHQYRARGLAIGSGMVESACKYVVGAREKGPGMRWTVAGAQAVAEVRVLLLNDLWTTYWEPAAA